MCYVVGLIGFQKATGMLDLRLTQYMSGNQPQAAAYSSDQGKEWLQRFEAGGDPTRVLFRHLLQVELDTKVIRRFVIKDKAPTRPYSWLIAATTTFTFKTLC